MHSEQSMDHRCLLNMGWVKDIINWLIQDYGTQVEWLMNHALTFVKASDNGVNGLANPSRKVNGPRFDFYCSLIRRSLWPRHYIIGRQNLTPTIINEPTRENHMSNEGNQLWSEIYINKRMFCVSWRLLWSIYLMWSYVCLLVWKYTCKKMIPFLTLSFICNITCHQNSWLWRNGRLLKMTRINISVKLVVGHFENVHQ